LKGGDNMKKINLNVGEILSARLIVNEVKGLLSEIRKALKILDKIELTEAEHKTVGMTEATGGQISWKDQKFTKEVELSDEQVELMKIQLKGKADFSVVGAQYAVSLAEKLDPEMFKEEDKK